MIYATVPQTGSRIKIASEGGNLVIVPDEGFDYSVPADRAALASLSAMYKVSAVVVPGGQEEQAVSTDVPPPQADAFVPMSQYQQDIQALQQQVAQLTQMVQQMSGQQPAQPQMGAQPPQPPQAPQEQGLAGGFGLA